MRTPKFLIAVLTAFATVFADAETKTSNGYEITLKAERESAVYKIGEDATFKLTVKRDGKPVSGVKLAGNITKDSVPPRLDFSGETDANGEFKSVGTLDEAGFLKCKIYVDVPATADKKAARVEMLAGAGFDPLKIKPSAPAPRDFDAFWNRQKKILKDIPMNVKLTRVNKPTSAYDIFDVQADTFNGKFSAYITMKKNSAPKSLPAIILPQGAGVYSSSIAGDWANNGFLALSFNVHGIPNGKPTEFYRNLQRTTLRGYETKNSNSRETIFFRTAFMRVMRAIEIATAQPQWDGKNLVIYGGSQGAGQAIAGAALRSDKITLLVAKYPALCDHTGIFVNRTTGWPHFVKTKDANGNFDREKTEAARYVDAVNFAERVKCPAIFTIHYADDVCEPTSAFAAYNNIRTKKELVPVTEARHLAPQWENDLMMKKIVDFVNEAKAKQK